MLDKFKKFKELRNLQSQLKKETVTVEKNGVSLTLNGEMRIKSLSLNPDISTEEQEKLVQECFHDAMDKIREKISGNFM